MTMTEWRIADRDTRYPRDVLVCTMPVVDWKYEHDDGNDPHLPQPPRPCGAELHIIYRAYVSLSPGMVVADGDFSGWADTSAWSLECLEGHVHATSPSGGRDDPDPFDISLHAPPLPNPIQ